MDWALGWRSSTVLRVGALGQRTKWLLRPVRYEESGEDAQEKQFVTVFEGWRNIPPPIRKSWISVLFNMFFIGFRLLTRFRDAPGPLGIISAIRNGQHSGIRSRYCNCLSNSPSARPHHCAYRWAWSVECIPPNTWISVPAGSVIDLNFIWYHLCE